MFRNDHNVMIVAEDPLGNGLSSFGTKVLTMQHRDLFPERPLGAEYVYVRIAHAELIRKRLRRVRCHLPLLTRHLVATAAKLEAHCPPDVSSCKRLGDA